MNRGRLELAQQFSSPAPPHTRTTSSPASGGGLDLLRPARGERDRRGRSLQRFHGRPSDPSTRVTAIWEDLRTTVIDQRLPPQNDAQGAVAVKSVAAAGTYDVTWTVDPAQPAQLWLVYMPEVTWRSAFRVTSAGLAASTSRRSRLELPQLAETLHFEEGYMLMRITSWLLICLPIMFGCDAPDPAGATEESVSNAKQAISYNAIKDSLKHPPKPFWTVFDEAVTSPIWLGDDNHGTVYTPLWRGANANIEDLIITPPGGNCSDIKGTVRVDWDKPANTVHITVKGRGIPQAPVVERTDGVNFFFNPFHLRVKDLLNTGYRLWTIFGTINTELTPFYYDATTRLLLGSNFDFPGGPPPNSITIGFPTFPLVSSIIINPDAQGNLFHQYTIPYDHVTQEGGVTGSAIVADVPHDLCQSNAADPTAGQLRPYVRGWLPTNAGPSFEQILHTGLIFDTSIEDLTIPYPNNDPPYVFSGASLMSNFAGMQGGTPNGYHLHLDMVIRNVAPVIYPIPGGNGPGCQPFFATPHRTGPNFCAS